MSSSLVWLLLKKHNSFVVKRNGAEFSTDPANITGKNTFNSSGLVNTKNIRLTAGPKNKGITLTPAKGKPVHLTRDAARTARAIAHAVKPNQRRVALARMSAILRSQRPVKAKTVNRTGPRAERAQRK
jgi:large subunit ribosomal protein L28e